MSDDVARNNTYYWEKSHDLEANPELKFALSKVPKKQLITQVNGDPQSDKSKAELFQINPAIQCSLIYTSPEFCTCKIKVLEEYIISDKKDDLLYDAALITSFGSPSQFLEHLRCVNKFIKEYMPVDPIHTREQAIALCTFRLKLSLENHAEVRAFLDRLNHALENLRMAGFIYEEERRVLKQADVRNSPKQIFNKLVAELYRQRIGEYKERTQDNSHNPIGFRAELAIGLSVLFDWNLLNADKDGTIDNAIDTYQKSKEYLEDQKNKNI